MNNLHLKNEIPYSDKEMKKALFGVLKYFDYICNKYGLKYSLAYGTLIGAARHKGFIPWDDDIDVMMPQDDYLKLFEVPEFKNQSKTDRFILYSSKNEEKWNESYYYPHAKIIDNSTICYFVRTLDTGGAFVDIFPITGLPNDSNQRSEHFKKVQKLRRKLIIGNRRDTDMKLTPLQMLKIVRRALYRRNYKKYRDKLIDIAFRYPFDTSDMVAYSMSPEGEAQKMPHSYFDEYIRLPFEGSTFLCIKEYDAFLKQMYGDWRKIPDKEKQISHHEYTLYKNPNYNIYDND